MVEKPSQLPPIKVSYEASRAARETATATDLSLGGLFVLSDKGGPAVGAFVALEIESGPTKVAVDGRVISTSPRGFAVSFIDLPNDVASALHFILATRAPRRGTTLGLGEAEEGVPKYESSRKLPADPAPTPPAPAVAPGASGSAGHPTPRIVAAAAAASPPPAPVPPLAPTSSSPAVVPLVPPARPSAPAPPSAAPLAPQAPPFAVGSFESPQRSRTPLVLAIVAVVVLGVLAAAIAILR